MPDVLPSPQEECLGIYDAVGYAENAFDVPVVAYAGSKDPQLQAARTVQAALKPLGIPMTLLIGTDLEHKMPPEWQRQAEAEYAKYAGPGKGRPAHPERVRFATRTLKTNSCDWVELLALERHYAPTRVEAAVVPDGYTVQTANVQALRLTPARAGDPQTVHIDGQDLPVKLTGGRLVMERRDGRWMFGFSPPAIYKSPGLQGPIDDAFTGPFLCVRGSAPCWHAATDRYAGEELKGFQAVWDKYLRADLPVKTDRDVSDEDLHDQNLILFGDPSSNRLIAKVLAGLPLQWDRDKITFAGRTFSAADHLPILIYPNPLNPKRYVVLNSGHTFHAAEFQGSNALLYPRLGDYAVLALGESAPEAVVNGLFDDDWKPRTSPTPTPPGATGSSSGTPKPSR
jgi:hypothetical protein